MKYNYREIGDRIRIYREGLRYKQTDEMEICQDGDHKFSQSKLLSYMRSKNLPTIARGRLSKLENGEESEFKTIPMGFIEGLCQVFGCSVGHLMGEYNSRDYDLQFIHDKTGLSAAAIDQIMEISEHTRIHNWSHTLSLLLEDPDFTSLIFLLSNHVTNGDKPTVQGRYYHGELKEVMALKYNIGTKFSDISNRIMEQWQPHKYHVDYDLVYMLHEPDRIVDHPDFKPISDELFQALINALDHDDIERFKELMNKKNG